MSVFTDYLFMSVCAGSPLLREPLSNAAHGFRHSGCAPRRPPVWGPQALAAVARKLCSCSPRL